MSIQPIRSSIQLNAGSVSQPGESPTDLNSKSALFCGIALLAKWQESSEVDLIVSENAKKFIRENIKWLTGAREIPIQFLAQTLYLFEQLCLAESRSRPRLST
jgi:hypothetical protein